MNGLVIRRPWIDLILSGKKIWEIRGTNTEKRGEIALIESGSQYIVGIARLTKVLGPLTLIDFQLHKEKHCATPEELTSLPYPDTYAWELSDAEPLMEPISYEHPHGAIIWVNLDKIGLADITSVRKIYNIPSPELREKLIKSIEKDLVYLNQRFDYNTDCTPDKKEIIIGSKLHKYTSRTELEDVYNKLRKRLLLSDKDFIDRMENKVNIHQYFANGDEIDLTSIKPEVRECISSKDKEIFKYCGYLEAVPSTGGIGRRISAIVWDTGQKREYIMGIIGLSSAGYSLKCRDDAFGWSHLTVDSFKEFKKLKDDGLKKIMQLSICMAVPPYNLPFSAKLMALLSFSDPIQNIYKRKYNESMLSLIATGIYGEHCAIYNRINLSNLISSDEENKSELFDKIGHTSEYSNLILSDETKEIAKKVLQNTSTYSPNVKNKNRNFSTNNELIRAIKLCGFNREILELNRKVVYVGSLHRNNIKILKGFEAKPYINLTVSKCVEFWTEKYLIKKFLTNPEKCDLFKQFKKTELSINEQLKLF
jgi:hypothetical protein